MVAEPLAETATAGERGGTGNGARHRVGSGGGGGGSTSGDADADDSGQWDVDDDGGTTLKRLTYAILAISILILLWKLHAFKLPTEIAAEQAQKAGKAAPSASRLDTILNWITPWRWGRGDLLKNTTPTGGDMGAHVFTPDFVRTVLLPKGRLTGWTDSSYAGMPVLNFYFPLPSLLIAPLSFILPYGIAFKLVTVLGIVTLPVAAYKSGRLALLRPPVPTLMALAGLIFVLSRNYDAQIYGGNILSTMAGEFSFSISLSCATLFLGLYVRALRTGRGRGRAGVMLALTGLCHLLPTLFALITAFFLLIAYLDPKRLRARRPDLAVGVFVGAAVIALFVAVVNTKPHALIAAGLVLAAVVLADWFTGFIGLGQLRDAFLILATGGAIAGFWVLPFMVNLPYSNDMGWEKMTKYIPNLFPVLGGEGRQALLRCRHRRRARGAGRVRHVGAVGSSASALRRHSEKTLEWNPTVDAGRGDRGLRQRARARTHHGQQLVGAARRCRHRGVHVRRLDRRCRADRMEGRSARLVAPRGARHGQVRVQLGEEPDRADRVGQRAARTHRVHTPAVPSLARRAHTRARVDRHPLPLQPAVPALECTRFLSGSSQWVCSQPSAQPRSRVWSVR